MIYAAPAESAPKIQPFNATRLSEINCLPRNGVVQGLGFDEGAVGAIVGGPNVGKTALAISLAVALAMRTERWLGLKIAGGAVAYFAAEAPGSVIMRAKAAAQRAGAGNIPLYISSAVPGLGGDASLIDAERIIETARDIASTEGEQIRLIALDTLAACLGTGDENGDGMMRLVGAAQRIALETGAFVLLIHHPSKSDATGLRGHGSLAAACDSIVRVELDEFTKVRTATLVKSRDSATGLQIPYELEVVILDETDSFNDPISTVVVKPTVQRISRPRPGGQRQRELLTELERRHRGGETHWDEATAREAGRSLGMSKGSARDALKGLIAGGHLDGSVSSMTLRYPPEDGTK